MTKDIRTISYQNTFMTFLYHILIFGSKNMKCSYFGTVDVKEMLNLLANSFFGLEEFY